MSHTEHDGDALSSNYLCKWVINNYLITMGKYVGDISGYSFLGVKSSMFTSSGPSLHTAHHVLDED